MPLARGYRIGLRVFLTGLSALSIIWAILVVPLVWQTDRLDRIAARILEGEVYKTEVLTELLPLIDDVEHRALCRPQSLRSAVIVRLRLVEELMANESQSRIPLSLDQLRQSTRTALNCSPSDAFLWLVLFWADDAQRGSNPRQFTYLRQSYRLGPYEGWIALRRSGLALSSFEELPTDIADAALKEFAGLLQSGFYGEVVDLFVGPGWPVKDRLLASIANVGEPQRVRFAATLRRLGFDVKVPGVDAPEPRPWQ